MADTNDPPIPIPIPVPVPVELDPKEVIRLQRVIEYIGPREWINTIIKHSFAQPHVKHIGDNCSIRELTMKVTKKGE